MWVAVNKNGMERLFETKPARFKNKYFIPSTKWLPLPKGSIKKLIGKELAFEDNPVKLKEQK